MKNIKLKIIMPSFYQEYLNLGRQFLFGYFLLKFSVNITLQSTVNKSCVEFLTMHKQNFKSKQPHKKEKWKYTK